MSQWLDFCSQMVSEKVGGAEGTKLDEDFKDLERVTFIYLDKYLLWASSTATLWFMTRLGIRHLMISCSAREQMLPAKRWWRSSIRPRSISSPTRRPEPSCPCSTPCPRSGARWRARATLSPRACWESAWPSMDETWATTQTSVKTSDEMKYE